MTKMAKIDTLFMTTTPFGAYEREPPPPPGLFQSFFILKMEIQVLHIV